ncbi:PIF-4 [Betabaculovirus altermyunipunctae]|uniref:PIF-4 n=1 Tax=Betabaculovirus altermyunipunctae TaxID=3051996 RepID=A0A1S5YED5_9BBAC|nr:PIF-4 [Betabaculovirus altermyunipunctae]AQQ80358.1 PIF-4 [Betabaculovirus altermyunipunctae]
MLTVLLVLSMCVLLLGVYLYSPLTNFANQLLETTRVQIYPSIRVLERDGDRLFVLEPEQIVLYNTAGVLYYYVEGGTSGRLCPENEFAIVRFDSNDISLINEDGSFNVSCTSTGSLSMYKHFEAVKYNETTVVLRDLQFNVLQIINFIIRTGLAEIR